MIYITHNLNEIDIEIFKEMTCPLSNLRYTHEGEIKILPILKIKYISFQPNIDTAALHMFILTNEDYNKQKRFLREWLYNINNNSTHQSLIVQISLGNTKKNFEKIKSDFGSNFIQ